MNETARVVRNRSAGGLARPPEDRRIRRTREALTGALLALVLEKRYGAITIQDLLDRADIGRSTFYAHYRGKDDLLLRSFERLLEMLDGCMDRDGPETRRVAPVRELFHHVGEVRAFHRALASAHMLERLYECGVNQMALTIARRIAVLEGEIPERQLTTAGSSDVRPGARLPAPVIARSSAGALFALLRWWVDDNEPYAPARMDEMFHLMVMPGVDLAASERLAGSARVARP
jgi:AcrR family transcriptional regulator